MVKVAPALAEGRLLRLIGTKCLRDVDNNSGERGTATWGAVVGRRMPRFSGSQRRDMSDKRRSRYLGDLD